MGELDPRAYDFERMAKIRSPLWRTSVCPKHGGYDDVVSVQIPLSGQHKEKLSCGCMKPWNEPAERLVKP
jgi:hypothetical protein